MRLARTVALVVAACEGPPEVAVEALPVVTGARLLRYMTRDGPVDVPHNLPDDIVALTADGEIRAEYYDDGTFTLSGMPPGEYVLRVSYPSDREWERFRLTASRHLEFVGVMAGRPDQTRARPETQLLLTGIPDDLGERDRLWLHSADAGAFVDLRVPGPYETDLIDATRGDRAWIVRHRSLPDGEGFFLAEAQMVDDLVIVDGGTTPIAIAVTPPARQERAHLALAAKDFAPLLPLLGPSVDPSRGTFYAHLSAKPPGRAYAHNLASTIMEGGGFDVEAGYGDPYPTEWTRTVEYGYWVDVPGPVAGASAYISAERAWDDRALLPLLAPVRGVRVEGEPASSPASGIGRQPVLSWEPPVFGVAAAYHVTICHADDLNEVGTISTTQTQVRLPEEVAEPFIALIEAVTYDGPWPPPLPNASSRVVTAVISP